MPGPFVHNIDPVIGEVAGLYLWWYGLSYTLGFLGIHLWFRRRRRQLGLTMREVYSISLWLSGGVLAGGRLVEVFFYEWAYYSSHLLHIAAFWLGGMSTHGLLAGAIGGTLAFCRLHGRSFLEIADELVIPGAWVMGVGRLGNFIDGQIGGAVTEGWWGVKFPDLEGYRHPVVLYDGLKNLALIPFLWMIRKRSPPRGAVFAQFVFWYAFLRLFVDLFREYRVESWGLGTGQIINLFMSVAGLLLIIRFYRRGTQRAEPPEAREAGPVWAQRIAFALLLLFCLTFPSDWTQDIPSRYGDRHPGLEHSLLYPPVDG